VTLRGAEASASNVTSRSPRSSVWEISAATPRA
jgi:hypothetical protein